MVARHCTPATMALAAMLTMACISPALGAIQPTAFQSFLPKLDLTNKAKNTNGNAALEEKLLAAIGSGNRLDNSDEVSKIVSELEQSGASIPRPAVAPEVYGRWRLVQTTNADTASPIQRKAVDATKYNIYQDIIFSDDEKDRLIVSQVVKFSDTNQLRVDALASTSAYPLPELTKRKGEGKVLGLNLLGVSLVGEEAQPDPDRPDSRIDFVFDNGLFDLGGFRVPYPVPFRNPLFRDLVKGWIDITYLSDNVRIARGNKGTTFVLVKEEETD